MDFIKRLIKLAMEYQDSVADSPEAPSGAGTGAGGTAPQGATPQPDAHAPDDAGDAGGNAAAAHDGAEPAANDEATVDYEADPEAEDNPAPADNDAKADNDAADATGSTDESPGATAAPEPPIEPAMFQNARQARLDSEDVTDTFLYLRPRRPSFFDKDN